MDQNTINLGRKLTLISYLLCVIGCNSATKENSEVEPEQTEFNPITVVVYDDPKLSEAITREWLASTGTEITVENATVDQLTESERINGDVCIYPSNYLGQMATQSFISEFSKRTTDKVNLSDFMPQTKNQEMRWGKTVFAASIGSPQWTLLYRTDIFEKLNLAVPTTWTEYQNVCKTLEESKSQIADTLVDSKGMTAEPIAPGWAAKLFLGRAASYARNQNEYSCLFNIVTMKPMIDQAPFVRALDELRASAKYMPDDVANLTPDEVANLFTSKSVPMAITWPSAGRQQNQDLVAAGVAVLPGSKQTYSFSDQSWTDHLESRSVPLLGVAGRLVSITKTTRDFRACDNFIAWICSAEQGPMVTNRSPATTLFRMSQAGQAAKWVDRALGKAGAKYFDVVIANQSEPLSLAVPNFPGQQRYLEALDESIRNALTTSEDSKQVLERVASSWEEITESLGRSEQANYYSQSLGVKGL